MTDNPKHDYTKATRTLDGRRVVVWDDPESPFVKGNFVGDKADYTWYREDGRMVNMPDFYTRSDLAPPSDEPQPAPPPAPQPDGPITADDCTRFINRAVKHGIELVLLISGKHDKQGAVNVLASMPKKWQTVALIGDALHTPHMLDIWETIEAYRANIHLLPKRQDPPQAEPGEATTNQA